MVEVKRIDKELDGSILPFIMRWHWHFVSCESLSVLG